LRRRNCFHGATINPTLGYARTIFTLDAFYCRNAQADL
jgi:hypothetical protein